MINEKKSKIKSIKLRILSALMDNKRFGFAELKREANISSFETLKNHLDNLLKEKLIEREEGRFGKYFINSLGTDEFRKLKQAKDIDSSISRKDIKWKGLIIGNLGNINYTASSNISLNKTLEEEYQKHMQDLTQKHETWMTKHGLTSSSCTLSVIQPGKITSLEKE